MGNRIGKSTQQRRMILEEIRATKAHPTAREVYDAVREHLPHISLATVYRNLHDMADEGVIAKLDLGGTAPARFDGDIRPHYHVRCVQCGNVVDMRRATVSVARGPEAGPDGFEILGLELEFRGLCPKCREHAPDAAETWESTGARPGNCSTTTRRNQQS